MTSENSQSMDFDEGSNERREYQQNDEDDMDHESETGTAPSPETKLKKTPVKENESEDSEVSDGKGCHQNSANDKDSEGTPQSKTGAQLESPIEGDTQEPDEPLQGKAINNDSGDDTEEYQEDDENSVTAAEMENTKSKKKKLSPKDEGRNTRQTRMDDFLSPDSSPDQAEAARSKHPCPDEAKAGRSSKDSSPDQPKVARSPRDSSPDKPKTARPLRLKKRWSDIDTEAYRNGYPNKKDDPDAKENLKFYSNKLKSRPEGDFIDNIHKNWKGDYKLLESHHGYIQWLFPIREQGMNYLAQELQLHEAEAIKDQEKTKGRVLKSYELMLDFYGMRLKDKDTGEIERAENWKGRFAHLNRSKHNHLRITRILKSLGELGYERFQRPFVEFVLREALEEKTLKECIDSCSNYWIGTVKNDEERKELEKFLSEKADSHPSCTV